ncbi:LPS export ABC transporter periplasmic protein LptC [Polynucleobacter sp. AP-Sanab-80-C2]|uniref:LPS export ABC transporter periplasmic protein LptC n=1 Tax=unclassified Polynucleobacter TaxID=2640945 RepID=UPI001BFDE57F|nr:MULTISPECIES: LPS export ABC transporter periplasmic protein LptC [unclassified Polynucleobacter]MEA9600082.1 LPS export ABC transporter periplasmic protein LptC [Polynucleobacter sp. AP-Sanab-80-C2]QWD70216.1 LPS export ABC transporter periplasmic protein LptC [Polynucleobacter sp. UB-Siik-W21]
MQLNSQRIKLNIGRTLLGLTPLLLMSALTLMTFWLVKKNTPPESSMLERIRLHEPDYIIKNGTLSALNEQGNTKYRILGNKVTHYDDDASIDIDAPRMRLFQPDKAPVTVKSNTGHLDGDLTILELFDNASIFRPQQAATATEPASLRMLASSSYFKVLINDDIVKTDRPITLEQGMSIMNSTEGGTFDNIQQSMTLSGQVKGRIERAPRGAQ